MNKKIKSFKKLPLKMLLFLEIFAVVFMGFFFGFGASVKAKSDVLGNNWMSGLSDKTKLCDINIPGTHDSGTTFTSAVISGAIASCQDDTIPEQLEKGVRYLDIRCDSNLDINHGGVLCYTKAWTVPKNKLTFNKLLDNVEKFLKDNPSETVILQIKKEGKDKGNFLEKINKAISSRNKLFNPKNVSASKLSLGDLRGKFVIFSRANGINFSYNYSGWTDNCAYASPKLSDASCLLQDFYKAKTDKIKLDKVKSFYERVWSEGADNKFVVNFTSCIGPYCPELVAKKINPDFEKYVGKNKGKKFGIVLMDVPKASLISAIYNSNFSK